MKWFHELNASDKLTYLPEFNKFTLIEKHRFL